MNKRIAMIRQDVNLSQEEFARKIGLSRNFVWMLEKGERIPSDRTVKDICREFHINETWLRTGVGDMKAEATEKEKLASFFADVLSTAPDDRSAFISALADLPSDFWPLVVDLAKNISANIKTKED